MPPEDGPVLLAWSRSERLTAAPAAFKLVPCLYVETDLDRQILRIGKASEGLEPRYSGGTGYALHVATHASGNPVFVATPDTPPVLDGLEHHLLIDERPPDNSRSPVPSGRLHPRHTGDCSYFRPTGM